MVEASPNNTDGKLDDLLASRRSLALDWEVAVCTNILVSTSADLCNSIIADVRLREKCPFRKLGISRNLRRNRIRVVQIEVVGCQIRSINCGKRYHYCREFRSINSFILRNWGACVDTVFGHVSRITG